MGKNLDVDSDFKRLLDRANAKKEIAGLPIKIVEQDGKLYLRGVFPRKDGVGEFRHRYPLKLAATTNFIPVAVTKAREIGLKLALGEFKWEIERPLAIVPKPQLITSGEWIAKFEREYWQKKQITADAAINYRTDYGIIFEKLDKDKALTIDRLIHAISTLSVPNTRSRVRWCNALGQLAELAGLDRQPIRNLKGNHSMVHPLEPRDIPDPDRVVEWFDLLKAKDPTWARCLGIYATYGIRPGELWMLDTSRLNTNKYHELIVRASKTGRTRVTYPHPIEWFDRFELSQFQPPERTAITTKNQGYIPTRKFKQLGADLECYNLRHFHAIQLILSGLDSATAAKWMGHSQAMFDRIYLHWMDERHHRQIFDKINPTLNQN